MRKTGATTLDEVFTIVPLPVRGLIADSVDGYIDMATSNDVHADHGRSVQPRGAGLCRGAGRWDRGGAAWGWGR